MRRATALASASGNSAASRETARAKATFLVQKLVKYPLTLIPVQVLHQRRHDARVRFLPGPDHIGDLRTNLPPQITSQLLETEKPVTGIIERA